MEGKKVEFQQITVSLEEVLEWINAPKTLSCTEFDCYMRPSWSAEELLALCENIEK